MEEKHQGNPFVKMFTAFSLKSSEYPQIFRLQGSKYHKFDTQTFRKADI